MKPILAAALLSLVISVALLAQRARTPPPPALPPISMTCAHHPDVLESKPGACPVCRLPLVPVRVDAAWMCPVHTAVTESRSGACRTCGRPLVPVTVSLTWTCAREGATEHLEPGTCADGSPRTARRVLRAHGNHNPQHGGQFFMAPDNWHHVEGVHPSARVFRLHVYDDYGRPLPADRMKAVQARVVLRETFDPATRTTKELLACPLRPSGNRPYLAARNDRVALPAEMTAKVRFAGCQPEHRFDFTFVSFSKELPAPARRTSVTQPLSSPPSPTAAGPTPAASAAPASSGAVALPPAVLPTSMSGLLELLDARQKEVAEAIARGDLGAVWVPAFQARDVAIALEPHVDHLDGERRDAAASALLRVVRTAWLLDAAGDVGNRAQVDAAYDAFTSAAGDAIAAFGGSR
jgi:hypothetical protein